MTTAYLTGRATFRAADILRDEEFQRNLNELPIKRVPLEKKEQFKLVWKCYIPPASTCVVTVGCILVANHVGTRRAAAMAAAFSISEKAASEYRDKVVEKFGENKEREMRDEMAQDFVRRNPQNESNVVIVGSGDVLCCDLFSGRYFNSSMEELKKAMNDTNYQIMHQQSASLTDFYGRIGLTRTDVSDELGWNFDKLMDLEFSTVMAEDGRPCIAYRFQVQPVRGFHSLR